MQCHPTHQSTGVADGEVAFEDSENEWEDVPQAKASDQEPIISLEFQGWTFFQRSSGNQNQIGQSWNRDIGVLTPFQGLN